jgi:N6-L-threonylcarbamoyladenine synthase
MKILGIETSCDETALCVVEIENTSSGTIIEIKANEIASQIALHAKYGGVYPMMAKREHAKNIYPILINVLKDSNLYKERNESYKEYELSEIENILSKEKELFEIIKDGVVLEKPDIDAIACTYGPGLEPALWVGINFAQFLSYIWNIPIIPVNHMEGHLLSSLLPVYELNKKITLKQMPENCIALLVSGGHTEILKVENKYTYTKIGQTVDDAAGEAFDKVARMLDLPYPGGPEISRLAQIDRAGNEKGNIHFPRPMIHSDNYNFSFSGLKTAVLYHIRDNPIQNQDDKIHIARAFEDATIEVLITKTMKAIKDNGISCLLLGGGVSVNSYLRKELAKKAEEENIEILEPVKELTGDNALMVAIASYFNQQKNDTKNLKAQGNLSL